MQIPEKRRFAHAFLTARVNRMVSTAAPPGIQQGSKKECWKQSKCPENNTCRQSNGAPRLAPDKYVRAMAWGPLFECDIAATEVRSFAPLLRGEGWEEGLLPQILK